MSRIGLTPDELLAATWAAGAAPMRYAAGLPGLDVLEGETVALVGEGAGALVDAFAAALAGSLPVDGAAARAGTLRIHAQQAARVGVRALAVSDPFPGLSAEAKALAVADLASFAALGLTTVVAASDPEAALLFADRVVLMRAGAVHAAYPVLAPTPRTAMDVEPVAARIRALAAA